MPNERMMFSASWAPGNWQSQKGIHTFFRNQDNVGTIRLLTKMCLCSSVLWWTCGILPRERGRRICGNDGAGNENFYNFVKIFTTQRGESRRPLGHRSRCWGLDRRESELCYEHRQPRSDLLPKTQWREGCSTVSLGYYLSEWQGSSGIEKPVLAKTEHSIKIRLNCVLILALIGAQDVTSWLRSLSGQTEPII